MNGMIPQYSKLPAVPEPPKTEQDMLLELARSSGAEQGGWSPSTQLGRYVAQRRMEESLRSPEERERESLQRRAFWGTVLPLLGGFGVGAMSGGRVVPDMSANAEYLKDLSKQAKYVPYKYAGLEAVDRLPDEEYGDIKPLLRARVETGENVVPMLLQIIKERGRAGSAVSPEDKIAERLAIEEGIQRIREKYRGESESPEQRRAAQASEWDRRFKAMQEAKEKDVGLKHKEEVRKSTVDLGKVESLMSNMWKRKKEQLSERVLGIPMTEGSGKVLGTMKKVSAWAKLPGQERTDAYKGQVTETAAALSRIVTGQSRIVQSIYNRIVESLPSVDDTESYAKAKIEQSVRNAYGLYKAMKAYGLDAEVDVASDSELKDPGSDINRRIMRLEPMDTDEEDEAVIQSMLKRIFSKPTSKESSAKPSGGAEGKIRVVRTQQEYDALPSGTVYREEEGGPLFRKP